MDKNEVIESLQKFKDRLTGEVVQAYSQRGSSFGHERFSVWRRQLTKYLDEALPGESSKLDTKLQRMAFYRGRSETDAQVLT